MLKIKRSLRKLLVRNKQTLGFFNYLIRKKNEKAFKNSLTKFSSANFSELKKLSTPVPLYPIDYVFDNQMYGIGKSLKKFVAQSKPTKAYIEHGVFFGNHVQFDEFDYFSNKIITFSKVRKKHLINEGCTKDVFPIGPYINYAESYYSEEVLESYKKKYGDTLLVFPPHSTKDLSVGYEQKKLLSKLEELKNEYDSVIICLYWADVGRNKLIKSFKDKGFEVTTAGHKYNPLFLSRLKSLILLSDMTISANVGTHVGYCISLGKPHWIINLNKTYDPKNESGQNSVNEMQKNTVREIEISEVFNSFNTYQKVITNDQKKAVEKYWGLSEIKSKNELKAILYKQYGF